MTVHQHKELFQGEMRTIDQAYSKGWNDATLNQKISERSMARQFTEQITRMVLDPTTKTLVERKEPGSWPMMLRAAEHLVSDISPETAASPHGTFPVEGWGGTSEWAFQLADTWVSDAMPALRYARLIEGESGKPLPPLPKFSTYPSAGPQPGEKQQVYSKAYDIQTDAGTDVDGSIYLNVSLVAIDMGFGPLNNAIMRAAASAEANKQIAQAVEAAATAGGLDIFTGRYVPNVVIVPPSELGSIPVADYKSAGLDVVLEPNVSSVLFADKNAIIGWFRKVTVQAVEPSTSGMGVTYKVFGKVGVDPNGVGAVAATP